VFTATVYRLTNRETSQEASGAESAGSIPAGRTIGNSSLLAISLEGFFDEKLLMHCLF